MKRILTQPTHPADGQISNGDMALTRMTARRLSVQWDGLVGKSAYAWFTILMLKHSRPMWSSSPWMIPMFIPMNGAAITTLTVLTRHRLSRPK